MLNIVEFALRRPVPWVKDAPFTLENLRGAQMAIYEPGESADITSPLWTKPTHRWLLNVRSDGIGSVKIEPVAKNSFVTVYHRGERPQDVQGIVHMLNRPNKQILLMGSEYNEDGEAPFIFKTVYSLASDSPFMEWVWSTNPPRVR